MYTWRERGEAFDRYFVLGYRPCGDYNDWEKNYAIILYFKKKREREQRGTHIKMVRQRASQAKHTAGHAIFVGMVGGLQGRKVASTYTLPSMYAHLVTLDLSLRRDDIWVGLLI